MIVETVVGSDDTAEWVQSTPTYTPGKELNVHQAHKLQGKQWNVTEHEPKQRTYPKGTTAFLASIDALFAAGWSIDSFVYGHIGYGVLGILGALVCMMAVLFDIAPFSRAFLEGYHNSRIESVRLEDIPMYELDSPAVRLLRIALGHQDWWRVWGSLQRDDNRVLENAFVIYYEDMTEAIEVTQEALQASVSVDGLYEKGQAILDNAVSKIRGNFEAIDAAIEQQKAIEQETAEAKAFADSVVATLDESFTRSTVIAKAAYVLAKPLR